MADKLPWELRFEAQRRIVSVSEPQRIVALPVFTPPTPEQIEEINRECVQAIPYNGGCSCDKCLGRPFRLLEDQANAVFVFKQTGRGFWNIEVGGGKTGACMLVASLAYQRNPSSKILLLIPPSVYDQFCLRDLPWGRAHLSLAVPFYGLQGSPQRRKTLAGMKRPGCYIMPYSLLSTTDTIELLRLIDADLIVADEGQNLMGEDSAKAKRFWSFVQTKKPKGVVMSGTLTRETPMEYRKLITLGLDVNSPLPRTKLDAVRWSAMLRSGAPEPDEFQDEVQD